MTKSSPDGVSQDFPYASRMLDRHGCAFLNVAFQSQFDAQQEEQPHDNPPHAAHALNLDDPAQRQFGDYELLELIGEGGMGLVYRARQISLDREVAIKLLAVDPWPSAAFVARFTNEARNAARMNHPHIVTIHEVGVIDALPFFSMQLIRGGALML